ncbi:restriction endonuclease PLD domain-containing protein [Clostridium gasigenes]|uniref:restriction endonuclease PLD domain-containing protein n=1 Tax=Clostridium gasigenes TaxID=94869 RepID=UPI001C0C50D9|nr:restriction endonuclease PLD domain-containing protein [Clostridium gasigenes]MBU3105836.1 NgoFVII family restriction endonuclease [Clostridium gasigenes]
MPVNLTLLDRYSSVHLQSGLNWGYSTGHVCLDDAYIPLKTNTIRTNPQLFESISNNNTISVTWDDGTVMTLLLEGRQIVNNRTYAKQISSYDDKSVLGTYFRNRLQVFNRQITLQDLLNYGRTDVTVIKTSCNSYMFDFHN